MQFYIIILAIEVMTMWLLRDKPKKAFLIGFLELFVFAAVRGIEIGLDNDSYQSIFSLIKSGYINQKQLRTYERGYVFLNQVVDFLGGEFRTLLVVVSLLSLIGAFYYTKAYSKYPWISIFLYICMGYYELSFTIWRQIIAVSFVLIAYAMQKDGKKWRYLLMIILAFLFHRSAILALLPFLASKLRITKKTILFGVISVGALYLLRNYIVQLVFALGISRMYMYAGNTIAGEGYVLLLIYVVLFFFIYYARNIYVTSVRSGIREKDEQIETCLRQIIPLSIFTLGMQVLSTLFSLLYRAGLYFSVPLILLLPNLLDCFGNYNNKKIVKATFYICFFLFFLLNLYNNNSSYNTMWSMEYK